MNTHYRNGRRGAVLAVVVWSVAICAIVVAAVQILAYRQATLGAEALGRVQARWAARAGVETMLAIMEYHTESPEVDDPMALARDMEGHSSGELDTGLFDIRHFQDGVDWAGPLDEHSKLNINKVTKAELLNVPDMSPDVADSLIDWRDDNDEVEATGAESDYYANRGLTYQPRNADFRTVGEMELVAGCWPEYVRGEDWNLNNRLDPQENDGSLTWPDDKPDGILDPGWSGYFTAYSRTSALSPSGEPRLALAEASAEDVAERTGLSQAQAEQLLTWAKSGTPKLSQLLTAPLETLASGGGAAGSTAGRTGRSSGGRGGSAGALPSNLLSKIFNECTLDDLSRPFPGRANINTVSAKVLENVLDINPRLVDTIVGRRDARPEGLTSVIDLLGMEGITPQILSSIADHFDVVSSVYSITSRGTSATTGAECEMFVVVDRSQLPVKILEYREQ
ncbi:MAG: hypothetical protein EXS00_09375 [Phycisphaerales bacterium]|nr:hypothetical protein [Phycisphaerales bacterium]